MARKKRGQPVHGWVIVDKPAGVTSTRVVSIVRRAFNAQKAGHGGTLDPLATGLLPIALGEATKTVSYVMEGEKVYAFTVRWGEARNTDDTEGTVTQVSDHRPDANEIATVAASFVGEIEQIPPAFSAIKVNGQRAYDLARSGDTVELAARAVTIHGIKVTEQIADDLTAFEVTCGKGTYVRSLARDMGERLGCFGHVAALRRRRVGGFSERDAISLADIERFGHSPARPDSNSSDIVDDLPEALASSLLPVETALDDIPALTLTRSEAERLRNGQPVPVLRTANRDCIAPLADGDTLWAGADGKPVALLRLEGHMVHPVRVLNI
jgi:tRNA pseudouridine55 synthase